VECNGNPARPAAFENLRWHIKKAAIVNLGNLEKQAKPNAVFDSKNFVELQKY